MVCNLLLNVSLYNLLETIGVTSYIYIDVVELQARRQMST